MSFQTIFQYKIIRYNNTCFSSWDTLYIMFKFDVTKDAFHLMTQVETNVLSSLMFNSNKDRMILIRFVSPNGKNYNFILAV